jgi:hypothetical protein
MCIFFLLAEQQRRMSVDPSAGDYFMIDEASTEAISDGLTKSNFINNHKTCYSRHRSPIRHIYRIQL